MKLDSLKCIDENTFSDFVLKLTNYVKSKASVDFYKNTEKQREFKIYSFLVNNYCELLNDDDDNMELIAEKVLEIAIENNEDFYP